MDVQDIAKTVFTVLETGRQVAPFSDNNPEFGLKEAYRVTAAVRAEREARGERPIGRKIGFTNRRRAHDPLSPPLAASEIVTTGTLTRAFPVTAGEEWSTQLKGIPLEGARIRFA
jgi:2-keto-4-pentenoate hydratase